MKEKVTKLIDVKSLVTLFFSVIFGIQTLKDNVTAEQFLTVFTTIIAFYFGTQHEKTRRKNYD